MDLDSEVREIRRHLTTVYEKVTDTCIVRGVCLFSSQVFGTQIRLFFNWILHTQDYILNLLALFTYLIQVPIFIIVAVNLIFEYLVQSYIESVS